MKKIKIRTGAQFGNLTYIKEIGKDKNNNPLVKCKCNLCGNIIVRMKGNVMRAEPNESCGCITKKGIYNKIPIGTKYNKLTFIKELKERNNKGDIMWQCLCECGNVIEAIRYKVINHHLKSCGCGHKLTYLNKKDKKERKRWKDGANRYTRRYERQEFVDGYKTAPCTDCGNIFPSECMDFDHIKDDKIDTISSMIAKTRSYEIIWQEIKKCELICANCHRIRTKRRRKLKYKDYL